MKRIRKHRIVLSAMVTLFFAVFSLGSPLFMHTDGMHKKNPIGQSVQVDKILHFHFVVKKHQVEKIIVKHPYISRIVIDFNHPNFQFHPPLSAVSVLLKNCILRI
jgi:hypothetical protein